ncbi:sugar nucleotide-binding protein [Candidatus Pelagibacter sp.]|nr:sugar nucleotide-binding protein [Candidatus Pelagibacter sp.]
MKKIIVTGGTGFFAINWYLRTKKKYDNYLIENKIKPKKKISNSIKLNLKNFSSLEKLFLKVKPDVLLHAAARTNLDLPKRDQLNEKKNHIKIIKNIVKLCKKHDIYLIFISSDQIYSGQKKNYNELDKVSPVNWYAKTKVLSEKYILSYKKSTIIRTNFFGWAPTKRKSFSDFIIFNINKKKINLYDNINYTPIFINNLINSIKKIIDKRIYGLFNIVGNESITKYKFGMKLASVFKFNKLRIIKSNYIQNKNEIIRPLNMSLSNKKLLKLGIIIPSLDNQLKIMHKEYKKKYYKKIRYFFI